MPFDSMKVFRKTCGAQDPVTCLLAEKRKRMKKRNKAKNRKGKRKKKSKRLEAPTTFVGLGLRNSSEENCVTLLKNPVPQRTTKHHNPFPPRKHLKAILELPDRIKSRIKPQPTHRPKKRNPAATMNDPGLNTLLKWSIENSAATDTTNPETASQPRTQLNPELLAQLMGGPSDADRMMDAMGAIVSPDVDLDNKAIAWDNFEQLVENLDNANNMQTLGLWTPLVGQLESDEMQSRMYAAWCVGTAVQNNVKSQERVSASFFLLEAEG